MKKHWSQVAETGGLLGLKATLWSYRILGKRITYALMYPVMVYYFIAYRKARKASYQYLSHCQPQVGGWRKRWLSFRHFLQFGQMIVDKLAVWSKGITLDQIDCPNKDKFLEAVKSGQGGVIFTAHIGNIEIARALSKYIPEVKVNALVFSHHAQKLNDLLTKINPEFSMRMISLREPTPELAMRLREYVDAGEYIVIAGDRTSVTQPQRSLSVDFLGAKAPIPQGAFILAHLLQCPCYFMVCVKTRIDRFYFAFEDFAPKGIHLQRRDRHAQMQVYAQQYADLVADFCQRYPLQWFNFFDFWHHEE